AVLAINSRPYAMSLPESVATSISSTLGAVHTVACTGRMGRSAGEDSGKLSGVRKYTAARTAVTHIPEIMYRLVFTTLRGLWAVLPLLRHLCRQRCAESKTFQAPSTSSCCKSACARL